MTKLENLECNFHPLFGTKYSLTVETDDSNVLNYLSNKSGMKAPTVEENFLPDIKDVIFNDPATIVIWTDGTKTIVKANDRYGDEFNPELGLAMAICKKALGNKGNYNKLFDKWIWQNPRLNTEE